MEDEHLSARFDRLLKHYQSKIDDLQLDIPEIPAPEEPAPEKTPEPPPAAPRPAEPEPKPEAAVLQAYTEMRLGAPPEPEPDPARVPGPEPAPAPLPTQPAWPSPEPTPLPPPVSEPPAEEAPPVRAVYTPQPAPAYQTWPGRYPPVPQAAAGPQRRRRVSLGVWTAAIAAVAAVAGVLSFWLYGRMQSSFYQAIPVAADKVRGLTWKDGRVYTADYQSQTLLAYDERGKALKTEENISNAGTGGITWADGTLWSTEIGRNAIYQHAPGPDNRIHRIYATPNRRPLSLCSDGDNIWAADAQASLAYRYLIGHSLIGTSLTPLNQYALPGAAPARLHATEGLLWVLDPKSLRLSRYRYDTGSLQLADSADLSAWLTAASQIEGMTASPAHLWILTGAPPTLHRFDLAHIKWGGAKP